MRNIRLSDGTAFPVDLCNIAFGQLQINIADNEQTVRGIAIAFAPEKAATIEEVFEGVETPLNTFEGYTELVNVGKSATGVYLTLKKP